MALYSCKGFNSEIGVKRIVLLFIHAAFPEILPSFQNTDVSFFIDAGNVWGVDYSSSISDSNTIRSSTGIAVNWYTPVGPLTFSLAQPLTKASTDITETFRFNIGTTF